MAPVIITRAQARAQGSKRYFTGKACKHGHVAERQVSNLTCMECTRIKNAADWHKRDREKHLQKRRDWRAANREKDNAGKRDRGQTPEVKAYKAAWFQANKARIQAKPRNNSASNVASAARWAKANPEKAREYSRMNRRNRRARAKNAGGSHTLADLAEILTAQCHRCAYCRADLKRVSKHVDHIMPLALGGSNGRANLQYLCRPCNQSKSARNPVDYARSIGLLL